jgi:flagellar hook-associated protein 1 FlgK
MSINAIMNSGLSALLANQAALRTTSSNIANVNTPDYVRRLVQFQSETTDGVLGGVEIGSVTRAVDAFLNGERMNAASASGAADAADRFLDQLQKAMGGVADGRDPASRVAAMTAGLAQLAADPASAAMKADFVQKLKDFAQGISDLAAKTQELRGQADAEIGTTVTRINDLTSQIAALNTPIQRASIGGDESSILRDQRDAAVRELAGLIDIRVENGTSGRINITTPTGYTLVSDTAAEATHIGLGTTSAETVFAGLTIIRRNGLTGAQIGQTEGFEKHITGGALRGLLDLRDVTLPNMAQQIGALAAGAAEAFNAASNASSSYPAPASLAGRNTGLLASDALGFTGNSTVAVVDAQGKLVRRVAVDFSAGTLAVDGGAATAFTGTVGGFTAALNAALGGAGSASFTDGALTLSASGGNGIAVQQDAAAPSDRAGRGFAHTFGLNDLFTSSVPTSFKTGLSGGDAHGFTAGQQVDFALRSASGAITHRFTYTAAGTTVTDMVAGLNAAAGTNGSFALAADGSIAFTAAGGASQRLEIEKDTTARGTTGVSLTQLFGIGPRYQMAQGTGLAVSPALLANPGAAPTAQLDLSATSATGDVVLASADNKGALALQRAGANVGFGAAGFATARTTSLADYAASLVAAIGQRSAAAASAAGDAASLKSEVEERAVAQEGVNLDEELANMMVFQQAYNAGARLITTAQKLYDELLGLMR